MSEIITRQSAIALKLPKYFTGVPCKNGHVAERYTQSSACQKCITKDRPTNPSTDEFKERRVKLQEAEQAWKIEHTAQVLKIREIQANAKLRALELKAESLRLKEAERIRLEKFRESVEARNAGKPKGDLVKFTATVQHRNANKYRDYAFAVTQLRDPTIDRARVTLPNLKAPTWSGLSTIGRYTVAAYPEDQATIFNYALELMKEGRLTPEQIAADRAKRDAEILAETNAEIDAEWPEESNA